MNICLSGPLLGDICGVPYEFDPECDPARINLTHPRATFSDDTVLTLAVAKAILEQRPYAETILALARANPNRGYGGRFASEWLIKGNALPYNSYGNGAAMRVSPVAWAFNTVEDVLREAEASAAVSHNHPHGIATAQMTALAVFLARKGQDKEEILEALTERFPDYPIPATDAAVDAEAKRQGFDETWQSVPLALGCFFVTDTFEDCLIRTIALGCDADTQAAISCAVAEAYYGPDDALFARAAAYLTPDLRKILQAFAAKYGV